LSIWGFVFLVYHYLVLNLFPLHFGFGSFWVEIRGFPWIFGVMYCLLPLWDSSCILHLCLMFRSPCLVHSFCWSFVCIMPICYLIPPSGWFSLFYTCRVESILDQNLVCHANIRKVPKSPTMPTLVWKFWVHYLLRHHSSKFNMFLEKINSDTPN